MSQPTPEQQIQFLGRIQRVLNEGGFVASYKFALLLALADLSVEKEEDSGRPLSLGINDIAEKYIQYYWPQSRPFPSPVREEVILKQNTGQQAAVVNWLVDQGVGPDTTLKALKGDKKVWPRLLKRVSSKIVDMPLWRLQTLGNQDLEFLYKNQRSAKKVEEIVLLQGVAYCFRRFHSLIVDLVHGAWIRYLRGIDKNLRIIGESHDLHSFLFGSDRNRLEAYRPILRKIQGKQCFYCASSLTGQYDIDHFVPWSRYPVDLGHNFVAAHKGCNSSKSDFLASERFLDLWLERNERCRSVFVEHFEEYDLLYNEQTSMNVTYWVYDQAEKNGAQVWDGKNRILDLDAGWKRLFTSSEEIHYLKAADVETHYGGKGKGRSAC